VEGNPPSRASALAVVGVCVGVAALYFAQDFIKPLALAFLLCFVLAPASNWLERRMRFNRVLSVLAVVATSLVLIIGTAWVIGSQVSQLTGDIPSYTHAIERKLSAVRSWGDRVVAKLNVVRPDAHGTTVPSQDASAWGDAGVAHPTSVPSPTTLPLRIASNAPGNSAPFVLGNAPWRDLTGLFSPVLTMLGTALVIAVFVIFMLSQREDLRDRLIRLLSHRHIGLTTQALDDAGGRISHYLRMLFIVNGLYGIALGSGMYLIGIPGPVLWGMMCALLRFVPYVGPLVSAILPLTLAVAIDDGWSKFFWTVALFGVIELVCANFVEPLVYGRRTGVSPMAVIISAAFWGWLWGIEGLLMATPLTLCLAVAGRHVPQLAFLNVLLGDEPALPVYLRYYQRLVAGDAREAGELLRSSYGQVGIVGAFDEVALPTLATAQRDARRAWIDTEQFHLILAELRTQVADLAAHAAAEEVVFKARGSPDGQDPTSGREAGRGPAPRTSPPKLLSGRTAPANGTPSDLGPQRLPVRPTLFQRGWSKVRNRHSRTAEPTRGVSGPRAVPGSRASEGELTNTYAPLIPLPRDCHPRILVLPARDDADAVAGQMLADVLKLVGYEVEVIGADALATERVERVAQHPADLIVISATPPSAVASTRYLLKKLTAAAELSNDAPNLPPPPTPIVVALWSARLPDPRLLRALRRTSPGAANTDGNDVPSAVVHSLCQALHAIHQRAATRALIAVPPLSPAR
jgi:predicted PurR-regulated permease PerM